MARWRRWVVAGCASAGLVGCGAAHGVLDGQGYRQSTYGYSVASQQGDILGPDWQVDNFADSAGKLSEKTAREYRTEYKFDTNGDGYFELEDKDAFLYDLLFDHKQRDALIWLRTFPIAPNLREKELRVLMQTYVDQVAGAGYVAVRFEPGRPEVVEKRFAAVVMERGPARIAGLEAYIATIDVANIDQIKLTPGQRSTRVRLALIRTRFKHKTYGEALPVLMVAGYANLPEDFATDLPAFSKLLSAIQIEGRSGISDLKLEPLVAATEPAPANVAVPSSNASEAPKDGAAVNTGQPQASPAPGDVDAGQM